MVQQQWDPKGYAKHARFVADLGAPLVTLLAPEKHEHILDLGCGDGALTMKLNPLCAKLTAVDASAEQVAAAKALGLDATVMDGETLQFNGEFDAVFSNAALHWMTDPDAVIAGVRRALKPGGRFVAEFGGYMNCAAVVVTLVAVLERHGIDGQALNPWYFPSPQAYKKKLQEAGFEVPYIELIPRLTPLPGHLSGWLDVFAGHYFKALPAEKRAPAVAEVCRLLEPIFKNEQGQWTVDYVRLRLKANIPE